MEKPSTVRVLYFVLYCTVPPLSYTQNPRTVRLRLLYVLVPLVPLVLVSYHPLRTSCENRFETFDGQRPNTVEVRPGFRETEGATLHIPVLFLHDQQFIVWLA